MTMKATARSSGSSCWSRTPSRSSCCLGSADLVSTRPTAGPASAPPTATRSASALVTIGFGIGAERDARDVERNAPTSPTAGSKEARRVQRRRSGVESTMVLGITNARSAASPLAVAPLGDVDRAVDAMRWEVVSPWAPVLEKLSTHPLVARRIQALEESGLPGSPRRWSIARSLASIVPHDRRAVRRAAAADGALAISPWLLLIAAVALGAGMQSRLSTGLALVTAGGLLLAKQARKYPSDFAPSEVTPLLGRLDASPVAGIPVELRGALIGRADAGNVLSPDLVLQDSTGFVPLARFSLVPLAGTAFAITQAESLVGNEVVARGWYRRSPTPIVELRELSTVRGDQSTRTWWWRACWLSARPASWRPGSSSASRQRSEASVHEVTLLVSATSSAGWTSGVRRSWTSAATVTAAVTIVPMPNAAG